MDEEIQKSMRPVWGRVQESTSISEAVQPRVQESSNKLSEANKSREIRVESNFARLLFRAGWSVFLLRGKARANRPLHSRFIFAPNKERVRSMWSNDILLHVMQPSPWIKALFDLQRASGFRSRLPRQDCKEEIWQGSVVGVGGDCEVGSHP